MTRVRYIGPKKCRDAVLGHMRAATRALEGLGFELQSDKRTITVRCDTKVEQFEDAEAWATSVIDTATVSIHYTGPQEWITEELCYHEAVHLYAPDKYTEDDVEAITQALLSVQRAIDASGVSA